MTRFGGARTRPLIAFVALATLASACGGGDGLAEGLLERQIEAEAGVDGVDIDLETGEIRVETEDGTFELDGDGDGGFTLETEDGTFVQGAGAEIPDGFPDEIVLPVADLVASFTDGENLGLSFESGEPIDDLARNWLAAMRNAGFTVLLESFSEGLATVQVENDSWRVAFTGGDDTVTSMSFVQLSVSPVSG